MTFQHEKLCVIDQAIAFMGGLDHCFGRYEARSRCNSLGSDVLSRWDTPQHVLVDDPEGGPDGAEYIWPGELSFACFKVFVGLTPSRQGL